MNPFTAIIFDLDGTLLDTIEDIGLAVNAVLHEFGYPGHELEKYKMFVGDGADELVTRALPENERTADTIQSGVERFVSYYSKFWPRHTRLFPGIPELLDTLCDKAIPLAILSNKPHDFTLQMVDELLGDWEFETVRGLQKNIPKKPDPTGALLISRQLRILPEHIYFIGDSGIDMHTALDAGMLPYGVSWGFRGERELTGAGARAVLNTPLQLLELMEK